MIIETKSRTSHSSLMDYLTGEGKNHECLGDNIGNISTEQQLDALQCVSEQNLRLKKNVFHASISLAPGENFTNNQWEEVARDFMDHMGFNNAPYTIIKHNDTPTHQHIHIQASRCDYDGKTINDSHSYSRAMKFARAAEIEYGLTTVSNTKTANLNDLTNQEIQAQKRGQKLIKTQVRESIQNAIKNATGKNRKDFGRSFRSNLKQDGVKVILYKHKNGTTYGMSFEMKGIIFKSSKLGKKYQYKQLSNSITQAFQKSQIATKINESLSSKSNQMSSSSISQFRGTAMQRSKSFDEEEYDEDEIKSKKKNKGRSM